MSISFVELRLNSGVHKVLCPYKHTGRGIDVENTLDSFVSNYDWNRLVGGEPTQPMWRINTDLLKHPSIKRVKCPKCGQEFIISLRWEVK